MTVTIWFACSPTASSLNCEIWWRLNFERKFAEKSSVSAFFGIKCTISSRSSKPGEQPIVTWFDTGLKIKLDIDLLKLFCFAFVS